MGCLKTAKPTQIQPISIWWGDKQEVIDFLNSPKAQADRWIVRELR